MAWRIDEQVVRGEIDNRTRGRVGGRIWLSGREEPVVLDLVGNPWRDLAGHVLRFSNPEPKVGELDGFGELQAGSVGDITASLKVKVPECSMEELSELIDMDEPFPWHWANSFYLEWFSERNGRVVVESTFYQLELDPVAAWSMSAEEETGQRAANAAALEKFLELVGFADEETPVRDARGAGWEGDDVDDDEDAPCSAAEAAADAEDERMELLLDRVTARLEREGHEAESFDRILGEERERLRRERGEKPEVVTPEQEAERAAWIEEMNAVAEQAAADYEAEKWKGEDRADERHPLVEHCSELAIQLHHDVEEHGWLPADAHGEHPLQEIVGGVMIASAKLAGALGMSFDDEEWPPQALFAGNVLVRLKKARGYLRDAVRGLDSADEESLATPEWRERVRSEVAEILTEVQSLIQEVREVLADEEEGEL